jgi:hypothetical protein
MNIDGRKLSRAALFLGAGRRQDSRVVVNFGVNQSFWLDFYEQEECDLLLRHQRGRLGWSQSQPVHPAEGT